MIRYYILCLCALLFGSASIAQTTFQDLVQSHAPQIIKGSVKTAPPVIADILENGGSAGIQFLESWQSRNLWFRRTDNIIFTVKEDATGSYDLLDLETGQPVGTVEKSQIKQIRPNSGLRGLLGASLVASQITSADLATRVASLDSLARDPKDSHLQPLRTAISTETDADLKSKMARLERMLTMQFDTDPAARVAAIESFKSDISLDVRARLNPMLTTRRTVSATALDNELATRIFPAAGTDLTPHDAYAMLVDKNLAPALVTPDQRDQALIANIANDSVGGINVADLNTDAAREQAYGVLAQQGLVPEHVSTDQITAALDNAYFYDTFVETSPQVVAATQKTLDAINIRVGWSKTIDLILDGVSLASIFFLAAIGLAITFGVMGVINMAHGEFIMMGAYTGFVVQQFVPNYTVSIILALPAAFAVTFAAGVLMERLIIRHLYHRPLETLLATFGVSIALQQLAKNIFGTQARPLTSPDWLGGALVINDAISISWIRVAIFALSILFFLLLWFTLNKTRLGLETRAVTQNPRMAASMGINPDKINMLTFGLGSGIAGIAGVAIGLFAKVTSELGSDYIVQSFMTVVVGGVGNIWGTLAGATMIGFLQKGIEWFNPSNTLAAQTFMIVFIIIFIQFRPRGIIALRGRAAGD